MARTVGSHGPKTLQAIRRAGLALIFEHGYAAMSLRQLAAKAGLQPGSLYNHIATKQELLFDLIRLHMESLLADLAKTLEGVGGPARALETFIAFHINYHVTRKKEVFISYSELRALEPKNYRVIVALRAAYEARLIDILKAGQASGAFAPGDARIMAYGVLAMLTGVCNWYSPKGALSEKDIFALYRDMIFDGLKPRH